MTKLGKMLTSAVLTLGLVIVSAPEQPMVEAKSIATDTKLAAKGYKLYTTKKLESVTSISRKTGTPINRIKTINGLKSNNVKGGKSLLVNAEIASGTSMWVYVSSVNTKTKRASLKRLDNGKSFTVVYTSNSIKNALLDARKGNGEATLVFTKNKGTYYVTSVKKGFK